MDLPPEAMLSHLLHQPSHLLVLPGSRWALPGPALCRASSTELLVPGAGLRSHGGAGAVPGRGCAGWCGYQILPAMFWPMETCKPVEA